MSKPRFQVQPSKTIPWKHLQSCLIACLFVRLGTVHGQPIDITTPIVISQENTTFSKNQYFLSPNRTDFQTARDINIEKYDAYDEYDEDQDVKSMFRSVLHSFTRINPDEMEPRETQDIITNGDIVTALAFPIFFIIAIVGSLVITYKFRSFTIMQLQRLQQRRNDIQLNNIIIARNRATEENILKESDSNKTEDIVQVTETKQTELEEPVAALPIQSPAFFPQSRSFIEVLNEIEKEVENETANTLKKSASNKSMKISLVPYESSIILPNLQIQQSKSNTSQKESDNTTENSITQSELSTNNAAEKVKSITNISSPTVTMDPDEEANVQKQSDSINEKIQKEN